MFEMIVTILFFALMAGVVRSVFLADRGLAKIGLMAAMAVVLPALVGCLLTVSGMFLLMPLGLMLMAFGMVKACV